MAVVSSDFLTALLTNFRTLFERDFSAAENMQTWRDIATQIPITTRIEHYNWFGTVPQVQDVTHGELTLGSLFPYHFTIENLLWKGGIEVERSALEDDQLTMITPRISQLADEAARHPGQLIFDLFEDNPAAYDGTAFFANTRVIGESANVDNLAAGAGVTVANLQTDIAAVRATMRRFQDDRGRVMNKVGNIIVCPPELEQPFYQALNANQGNILNPVVPADAQGRIVQVGYVVLVNPFLTDPTDWYLLDVRGPTKPFIYQTRVPPALEGITNPNTESGVLRDKFVYSSRARYNVGVGEPRQAIKVVNA